ncbi:50S ribosomal protein L6, partial [Acinetobacter sp. NS4_7]
NFVLPQGVEAAIEKNIITLKGYDKQVVGQAAANLRALKKPEPYKGKGIKFVEERIRRKAGKTAAKG